MTTVSSECIESLFILLLKSCNQINLCELILFLYCFISKKVPISFSESAACLVVIGALVPGRYNDKILNHFLKYK